MPKELSKIQQWARTTLYRAVQLAEKKGTSGTNIIKFETWEKMGLLSKGRTDFDTTEIQLALYEIAKKKDVEKNKTFIHKFIKNPEKYFIE